MSRRSKAREAALQMLFQIDLNPDVDPRHVREMINERITNEDLQAFAWSLFVGVREYRDQIDEKIETVAENWSIQRMAPTDRNALRIGVFEILHFDTPTRVAIDEAIELAKRYGTKNSSQFVNGILDQFAQCEGT